MNSTEKPKLLNVKMKKRTASLPEFVLIKFAFKITPVPFFVFLGTCCHIKLLTKCEKDISRKKLEIMVVQ